MLKTVQDLLKRVKALEDEVEKLKKSKRSGKKPSGKPDKKSK